MSETATRFDADLDELGPVDYVVVEFPPGQGNFDGQMAQELVELAESGTVRLLDLMVLTKADNVDELRGLETLVAEVLAAEDVVHLAEAMEPGTTAGVLVWENTWAAPFAAAARRSGGQLIASGRIPIQALLASLEAEGAEEEGD